MWTSLEGINGVGKTHLAHLLARDLGEQCALVTELTDGGSGELTKTLIGALAADGDFFLRTGVPLTETFTLLALKVHDYERLGHSPAPIMLEDRGVDTVAMYQSVILAGPDAEDAHLDDLVHRVQDTAAQWRPRPDLTLLISDDVDTCLERVAQREGHRLPPADEELIRGVDRLYHRHAAADPDRWRVIDRTGRDSGAVLAEMRAICLHALTTTAADQKERHA